MEPKLELISGTFGRGEGRYHEGVFALPNRERRSIASVARIEVDTSLEGNSRFGKALKNAFDFGVTGTVVGLLAAPAAIASGPFGLTIGAIAAGIGLFGGGRERISIIHIVFEDGADLVAIADATLGPFLARERSLLGRQKNTPALAAPPAPPPPPPAPQVEPAGEETVAVLWSAETRGSRAGLLPPPLMPRLRRFRLRRAPSAMPGRSCARNLTPRAERQNYAGCLTGKLEPMQRLRGARRLRRPAVAKGYRRK